MSQGTAILVLDADPTSASALLSTLRTHGHAARAVSSLAEASVHGPGHLVVFAFPANRAEGFRTLEALARREDCPPTIVVARQASVEDFQRAMRMGVREFLVEPYDADDLLAAIDRWLPKPALPAAADARDLELRGTAELDVNARSVRRLLAYLVEQGFSAATRARIAGATAEVLENVVRHAYPDSDGGFELSARLRGRRLTVQIQDRGVGFDVRRVAVGLRNEPLRSGLARARALSEELRFESTPGAGTRVVLEFTATQILFNEDRGIDLSELDYLDPATARRVLLSLRGGGVEPQFHLSPALAVCIGRMLSSPRTADDSMTALWSS